MKISNIREIEERKLNDNEYMLSIRMPDTFDYIPILITEKKSRVIKYMNDLYNECEELRFRVDTTYNNTFVNKRENIDYFDKRKRLVK